MLDCLLVLLILTLIIGEKLIMANLDALTNAITNLEHRAIPTQTAPDQQPEIDALTQRVQAVADRFPTEAPPA
jgi:hypothetical protein